MNFPFALLRSLRLHPMQAGSPAPASPPAANSRAGGSPQPQYVELDIDVPDVKRALEHGAATICRAHGLDAAPVFRALWRREQIGSTAIGRGVALPHARIADIAEPLLLFMRLRYAVDFGAPDDTLVTQLWVILVPPDGSADDHLKLLASLAEISADDELRARLEVAVNKDDVARAVADWLPRRTG
jgi:nitrogen PTS system EIIA component